MYSRVATVRIFRYHFCIPTQIYIKFPNYTQTDKNYSGSFRRKQGNDGRRFIRARGKTKPQGHCSGNKRIEEAFEKIPQPPVPGIYNVDVSQPSTACFPDGTEQTANGTVVIDMFFKE